MDIVVFQFSVVGRSVYTVTATDRDDPAAGNGRVTYTIVSGVCYSLYEPCEKTGLRGFRPGLTQTRLYSHIR